MIVSVLSVGYSGFYGGHTSASMSLIYMITRELKNNTYVYAVKSLTLSAVVDMFGDFWRGELKAKG